MPESLPAFISPEGPDTPDVVVIGAGAAGLGAAAALLAGGLTVQVIEARDRPGGRTQTRLSASGARWDAGAAYIHFAQRNPWLQIAAELGVETPRHRGWGPGPSFRGSRRIGEDELRVIREGREALWTRLEEHGADGPDISLADLAADGPEAMQAAARRFGRQAIGEDPGRISVADLATQWEGDDRVIPFGYGALVARTAQGLPIAYETPALAVDWSGEGVRVETTRGSIRAQCAVVTAPVGVLKAGAIRFRPDLPQATQGALDTMQMGALTKVALAIEGERFGFESAFVSQADGPFVFELWPFGQDLVLATIGGTPARDLAALGEEGAAAATLDALAQVLGGGVRTAFRGGQLASWGVDRWAAGSYSFVPPGGHAARHVLAEPLGDRLYFAGEATSGGGDTVGGAMTVGGATLAGRKAAAAILQRLQRGR